MTAKENDRRAQIADAAIELLGTEGARGLTHRGVDKRAGLPLGSTSFYCRTRAELLALTLHRHAQLDLLDIQQDWATMPVQTMSWEQLLKLLMARVQDWASPAKRVRLVARFELFLMATREASFAKVLSEQRQAFVQLLSQILDGLGATRSQQCAHILIMVMDGYLLDQVRSDASSLDDSVLYALLQGALDGRLPHAQAGVA